MGLLGIALSLLLLLALAYRSWSVLLLAPTAALVAAAFAGEPLLAHWTQTFMGARPASWPSSSRFSCLARCSES
jgi:H+/gluconate symporter-like permease